MGIDYAIPHPCANREELGETGLRRWTFLYMIYKYMRDHPELLEKDLSEQEWRLPVASRQGEEQRFSYDDIKEVGVGIGPYLERCRRCPANLDPKADEFGCVGRINYPILACFEELVATRLQQVIDRQSAEEWPTLLKLILRRESPFDGGPIAKLRATVLENGSRLFELQSPVPFQRAGDGISTDQIMHALIGLASFEAEKTGYSREVPKELSNIYLDFLSGLLYANLSEERVLDLSRRCSTFLQFRWLHRALRISYQQGHTLLLH